MKIYGISRIFRAAKYTADGIKSLWLREEAFRQELLLVIVLMPIIFFLTISGAVKLILISLLLLILVIETINSAIETIIDRISLEINPESRIAKDLGSAAVGITLLMNLIAWIYVIFFI